LGHLFVRTCYVKVQALRALIPFVGQHQAI